MNIQAPSIEPDAKPTGLRRADSSTDRAMGFAAELARAQDPAPKEAPPATKAMAAAPEPAEPAEPAATAPVHPPGARTRPTQATAQAARMSGLDRARLALPQDKNQSLESATVPPPTSLDGADHLAAASSDASEPLAEAPAAPEAESPAIAPAEFPPRATPWPTPLTMATPPQATNSDMLSPSDTTPSGQSLESARRTDARPGSARRSGPLITATEASKLPAFVEPSPVPSNMTHAEAGTAASTLASDAAPRAALPPIPGLWTPGREPMGPTLDASAFDPARATGTITVPIEHPEFGAALGERISWLVAGDWSEAELALHPAELGPIRVRLTMEEQTATIELSAGHPDTTRAIEEALPKLHTLLEDQGVQVGQVHIGSDARPQSDQSQQSPSGRQERKRQPPATDTDSRSWTRPEAVVVRKQDAPGRLDLFA